MRQSNRPYFRQDRSEIEKDLRSINDTVDVKDVKEVRDINEVRDVKDKETKIIKEMAKGFIGKNIAVMLRGKKTLKGRLESTTNYELILTINHKPVLVMKHAVDYIELTEEDVV